MSEIKQTNDHRRTNDQPRETFVGSDILTLLTAHLRTESWMKGDCKELEHFEGPFNKGKSGFEMLTYKSEENRQIDKVASFDKTYNVQLISKAPEHTYLSPIKYTKFFSQFKFVISNVYKKKPALNAHPKPNSASVNDKNKTEKHTMEEKEIKNKEKLRESIQRVKRNKNNTIKIFKKFKGKTLHYHSSNDCNIKSITKIVGKKVEDRTFLSNQSKKPNTELGDGQKIKCVKENLKYVTVEPKTEKHSIFKIEQHKTERGAISLNKNKNCIKQKVNDYKSENNKRLQDDKENIHIKFETQHLNFKKPAKIEENENRLHNDKVELERKAGSPMEKAKPAITLKHIKDDIIRGHSLRKTQKKKYSKQPPKIRQNDDVLEHNQTELEREMETFLKNHKPEDTSALTDDFLLDHSRLIEAKKQSKKSRKNKSRDVDYDLDLDYDQATLERELKYLMKNTKRDKTFSDLKNDDLGEHNLNDIQKNKNFRQLQQTGKYDDKLRYDKVGGGVGHFMKNIKPGTILGNIIGGESRGNHSSDNRTNKVSTQLQKDRQNNDTLLYEKVELEKENGYLMKNTKPSMTVNNINGGILKGLSKSDNQKNDLSRQSRQIKPSDDSLKFDQVELEKEMEYSMNNIQPSMTISNIKDDIIKGHSKRDTQTKEHSRKPDQNGKHDGRLQNDHGDIGYAITNTQPSTTLGNITDDNLGNNKRDKQKNELNRESENRQDDDILHLDQAELEREVGYLMKNTKPGMSIRNVDDMFREHSQSDFFMNDNFRPPERNRQNGDRQHNQAQPQKVVKDLTINPYRDMTLMNITDDLIKEYSKREGHAGKNPSQSEQTLQCDDTLHFNQAELEREVGYLMKNTKLGIDRVDNDNINDYRNSNKTENNDRPLNNVFGHTFEGESEYREAGIMGDEKTQTKNDRLKTLHQLKQELEIVLKYSHLIQPNLFKGSTKVDNSNPLKYDGGGEADDVKYYKKVEFNQLHNLVNNAQFKDDDDFTAEGASPLDDFHSPRPPSPPIGARHISSIFNEMADEGFGTNSNNTSHFRNIVSDIRRDWPGYRGPRKENDTTEWYANKKDVIEGSKELYKKVVETIDRINRGEEITTH